MKGRGDPRAQNSARRTPRAPAHRQGDACPSLSLLFWGKLGRNREPGCSWSGFPTLVVRPDAVAEGESGSTGEGTAVGKTWEGQSQILRSTPSFSTLPLPQLRFTFTLSRENFLLPSQLCWLFSVCSPGSISTLLYPQTVTFVDCIISSINCITCIPSCLWLPFGFDE